jgi:hypothetical protein
MHVPLAREPVDARGHSPPGAHQAAQRPFQAWWAAVERQSHAVEPGDAASGQLPVEQPACHVELARPRSLLWIPAPCQIPHALVALSANDRDPPRRPEYVQHLADVLAVVPPARAPRHLGAIIEVARSQRAAPPQLAQHVAREGRVRGPPLPDVGGPGGIAGWVAAHGRPVERVVAHRQDERPVLEQPALFEHQAVDLSNVVDAQPAEQHQPFRARHRIGRVHLQPPQMLDHLQHGARPRTREPVGDDRDPGRLLAGERDRAGQTGSARPLVLAPHVADRGQPGEGALVVRRGVGRLRRRRGGVRSSPATGQQQHRRRRECRQSSQRRASQASTTGSRHIVQTLGPPGRVVLCRTANPSRS